MALSDDEAKFLLKLSKKSKGGVDMDLATRALERIGFTVTPKLLAVDLDKYNGGDWILQQILKDQGHPVDHLSSPRYDDRWSFRFDNEAKALAAYEDLLGRVTVVERPPTRPELGELYISDPRGVERSNGRHVFGAKQIWIGDTGSTITAPSGKSIEIATPLNRRGLPSEGPVESASLWTFLYKNGADTLAKAVLAAAGSDVLERATSTKAQRESMERRRRSLPEIESVFTAITEARYAEIIEWIRSQYMNQVAVALLIQEKYGEIPYKEWSQIPAAQGLMDRETVYEANKRRDVWRPKKDVDARIDKMARQDADAIREAFVEKNTFRISEIARLKGSIPSPDLLRLDPGPSFNSEIRFSFADGSRFDLRNNTVWKRSPLGRTFAQFPTTFHNVVLPGGKKMSKPSEERMLDVFAGKAENPAIDRRQRELARRLARGE